MRSIEKKVLSDQIRIYRSLPCLWDPKDRFYANRRARDRAYEVLLKNYRVMEPEATIRDLKKKLDNMRCTYKKELRKVLMNKRSETKYVPSLWYFKDMLFLDQERAEAEGISFDCEGQDDQSSDEDLEPAEAEGISVHCDIQDDHYSDDEQNTNIELKLDPDEELSDESPTPVKKNKKNSIFIIQQNDEDLQESFKNTSESVKGDSTSEAELYGRAVGLQLKALNPRQKIIAERMIAEVIFFGRLDQLTVDSSLQLKKDH